MNATRRPDTPRLLAQLRFRHLQLIVELGRSRSLRASAAAFGVTQPALSRSLGEIEAAFGFDLFHRSTRGVAPTPAGEVAIRGAALLLEEMAHLQAEAAQGERAAVLLRLGATPFVAQACLPVPLAALGAGVPPVRTQLVEGDIPTLVDGLLQGRLDAVVCTLRGAMGDVAGGTAGAVAGEPWGSRLRYEALFHADYAVISHHGHPLARRRRIGWDQLVHERWILPPPRSRMFRVIEEQFVRHGLALPSADVETGVPVTVVRLAAAGAGLAIVPALTLSYLRAKGEVARLAVQPPVPGDEVGLVLRAGPDNPRVALLRRVLQQRPGRRGRQPRVGD